MGGVGVSNNNHHCEVHGDCFSTGTHVGSCTITFSTARKWFLFQTILLFIYKLVYILLHITLMSFY